MILPLMLCVELAAKFTTLYSHVYRKHRDVLEARSKVDETASVVESRGIPEILQYTTSAPSEL